MILARKQEWVPQKVKYAKMRQVGERESEINDNNAKTT